MHIGISIIIIQYFTNILKCTNSLLALINRYAVSSSIHTKLEKIVISARELITHPIESWRINSPVTTQVAVSNNRYL